MWTNREAQTDVKLSIYMWQRDLNIIVLYYALGIQANGSSNVIFIESFSRRRR